MEPKTLPLHHIHEQLGAKIVPFAGFLMPVRYSSDIEEHMAVRRQAGVFDVSHMGEFTIKGPQALDLIQRVTSNDAAKLINGQAQYTCLPNRDGGIVDDCVVYRKAANDYLMVVNAANIQKDWEWIQSFNTQGASMENVSDDWCLFAVQGPKATQLLQCLTPVDLTLIEYYHFAVGEFAGMQNIIISNTGYTGAGGFELYAHRNQAEALWNALFSADEAGVLKPIGLGARDTLRMEMGFCLYGNDIDDTTSPIEAGLGWITKFTKSFTNSEALKKQKEQGVQRKLAAFVLQEKGIPRHGYAIVDAQGKNLGTVTSGAISPILNKGIGLGYVSTPYAAIDSDIYVDIRGKKIPAKVVKLPFI